MNKGTFAAFVGPSVFIMLALMTLPLLASIVLGLHYITFRNLNEPLWIGLRNYQEVLADAEFWDSLEFTLLFILAAVPARIVLGLLFALLLDQITRFRGLFIAAALVLFVMTPVVGTLIFRDMFDRGGPYWYWMQQLFDYRLFMNSTTVPLLIIFHSIWTATPFAMIVLFAGLQTLPQESLEAARVDGASWFRQLWHVAIPHLRSLFVIAFSAGRIPAPNSLVYIGCIFAGVIVALILPQVVNTAEFYDYLINSVIVTMGTLCISLTIGALAGYGLARYRHVVSVYILVIALAFRSLPSLALVLPFYYLGQLSGLYDTHILLILCLVAVNQPFTIWMLRSFFMEIPREIEEAAMIDGAGRLRSFVSVIVPIMWPGIITTGLFTLLLAYNDFLLARILTQINWTLPVGIAQFTGGEDPGHVTLAAAASVSTTMPILFVIIFFQKYLIRGLASGAVKG